jgi:hypothetical protein
MNTINSLSKQIFLNTNSPNTPHNKIMADYLSDKFLKINSSVHLAYGLSYEIDSVILSEIITASNHPTLFGEDCLVLFQVTKDYQRLSFRSLDDDKLILEISFDKYAGSKSLTLQLFWLSIGRYSRHRFPARFFVPANGNGNGNYSKKIKVKDVSK